MLYEVTIPDWTEGKPLRVEHVEANCASDARGSARRLAPDCPLHLMTVRECRCKVCEERRHQEFRAGLGL